jgi:transposase
VWATSRRLLMSLRWKIPAAFLRPGWLVPTSAFALGRRTPETKQSQLRITKAGDELLRSLLVECAHHIIGPLGADSDLRRWGLKLAERGGKNAKKRAVVAVARKLLCSSSPPVGDR